jgi:hypothetical protein
VYIFVLSHDLANVTNAAPVAGYLRDPPRRFVSSSSAAPTAPPGSALLAFPGAPQVSPRPQRSPTYPSDWLLLPPSNRPGADDDGESDVDDYAGGPPDETSLHPGRAKIPEDDPTTILTTTPPFELRSIWRPRNHDIANNENPAAVDDAGGTTPLPLTRRPLPSWKAWIGIE